VPHDPGHRDGPAGTPADHSHFPVPVRGVDVDAETRCAHYHSARDVVAIRFPCCDAFYPCFDCHGAVADHAPRRWPRDRLDHPAVLCGACGTVLSAATYLELLGVDARSTGEGVDDGTDGTSDDPRCPDCGAGFNSGCAAHADRYFAVDAD